MRISASVALGVHSFPFTAYASAIVSISHLQSPVVLTPYTACAWV
jgi:hypothetical protein